MSRTIPRHLRINPERQSAIEKILDREAKTELQQRPLPPDQFVLAYCDICKLAAIYLFYKHWHWEDIDVDMYGCTLCSGTKGDNYIERNRV